jgi:hypothetical protein
MSPIVRVLGRVPLKNDAAYWRQASERVQGGNPRTGSLGDATLTMGIVALAALIGLVWLLVRVA